MAVPAAAQSARPASVRSGPTYWLGSYLTMVRWQVASLRLFLPVLAAIQILAGVGFVLGFGLFFPGPVPARSALYLSTGVTVVNLYLLGLVVFPQVVVQQKLAQTYDFVQSLPVPRAVAFAAVYTVTLGAGVPAMVVSLFVAVHRYDIGLAVSPSVIPATLLVSVTSTAVGYALGHAIAMPMITQMATQVLNLFAIGFSPVLVPSDQLPHWLATLNRGLPFESMATVMRSALSTDQSGGVLGAYALLGAWSCACLLVAAGAVGRRG